MTCPLCHSPLSTFYSQSKQQIVCQCGNPQCEMCRKQVNATGEFTREAVEYFVGLSLKHEERYGY